MKRPSVKRLMSERTKIQVQVPYRAGPANWALLHQAAGDRVRVEYASGVFRLSRQYLKVIVEALAREFGAVDVTLEFNENEQCDTRCQSANPETFYNCTCACLAANHGGIGMGPEWLQVGETTLINPQLRRHEFVVTRAQVGV